MCVPYCKNCFYWKFFDKTMVAKLEQEWGLNLTEEGIAHFTEELNDGSPSWNFTDTVIRKHLLETDIRQIPPTCFSEPKMPTAAGESLLVQLIKALDISRPIGPEGGIEDEEESTEEEIAQKTKVSKTGKRLLRFTFVTVSGNLRFDAIEVNRVNSLPAELVPGTKFLLSGPLTQMAGIVLINSGSAIQSLGGRVNRLAESFKQNRDAQARRGAGGDRSGDAAGGPPKFVSFMDYRKRSKKQPAAPAQVTTAAPSEPSRAPAMGVDVSDKIKELQSVKLSVDAFAMKQRGAGKGERKGRRESRRDREAELDQYKPPSRNTPQLAAFVKFDKGMDLHEAHMLAEAARETEIAPISEPSRGKGFGKNHDEPFRGKGKGKGRGRPVVREKGVKLKG